MFQNILGILFVLKLINVKNFMVLKTYECFLLIFKYSLFILLHHRTTAEVLNLNTVNLTQSRCRKLVQDLNAENMKHLVQCFLNFFGDPKSLKTTICKHECDPIKFD